MKLTLTKKQEIGRALFNALFNDQTIFAIYSGKKLSYYTHIDGRLLTIACEIPRLVAGAGAAGDAALTAVRLIQTLPAEILKGGFAEDWAGWITWEGKGIMQTLNMPK